MNSKKAKYLRRLTRELAGDAPVVEYEARMHTNGKLQVRVSPDSYRGMYLNVKKKGHHITRETKRD